MQKEAGRPARTPNPQPETGSRRVAGSGLPLQGAPLLSEDGGGEAARGGSGGGREGPGKTAAGPEEGEAGAGPVAVLGPGVGCPEEARAGTHVGGSWDDARLCTFWKVAHSPGCGDHGRTEHVRTAAQS